MDVRRAVEADRPRLAAFAARLQVRPDRHVAYLALDTDTIAAEMVAEDDDWTAVSAVATVDNHLAGWLMGSVDVDMGRVWWFGPFVDAEGDRWTELTNALFATAGELLPAQIDQEEMAPDTRFDVLADWATEHGFTRDPGSLVLTGDLTVIGRPMTVGRPMVPSDAPSIGPLHDQLFPDTHTPGNRLAASTADHRVHLVVDVDDTLAGYVAVERQPDGSGYVDYLGVDPRFRRRGLGADLVRAGAAALAGLGCERCSLTVRDDNLAARRLYTGLGFAEERVIVPYRRGFSIA